MYKIKTTKLFDKRFANLKKIFDLSDDEATDATETLKYTMILLQRDGKLPSNKDDFDNINDPNGPYYDHKLTDEPWIGFNEYHILNDLLVVYYKVDSKKTIRFTTITTHDELRKGKLKYAIVAIFIRNKEMTLRWNELCEGSFNFGLNFLSDVITSVYYITMYYIAM